ncbi:MAG: hypothetical protein ACTH9T_06295 [Mycetocola reblochoni]|nr:hypothetical protein [Mycetocola reblochoni]
MTIDNTTAGTTAESAAQPFVAYEYSAVTAPRGAEPLYQDVYRGLGWSVERVEVPDPVRALPLTPSIRPGSVTLRIKRDRGIRNRLLLTELQRKAEARLASIDRLSRSTGARALAVAIGFGIVGSALLAGSVFTLDAGLVVVSIALGAAGLLCWLGGFVGHRLVSGRRAAAVAPELDREHDALSEVMAQAARLLG